MILKKASWSWWIILYMTKTVKNLRNNMDVRFAINFKDFQNQYLKQVLFPKNIFNKYLVSVHKIKEMLTLKYIYGHKVK